LVFSGGVVPWHKPSNQSVVGPYEFRRAIEQKIFGQHGSATACGKGGGMEDTGFDRLFVSLEGRDQEKVR
jgi:hypothetical protein